MFQSAPGPIAGRFELRMTLDGRDDRFQSAPGPIAGRFRARAPNQRARIRVSIRARPDCRAIREHRRVGRTSIQVSIRARPIAGRFAGDLPASRLIMNGFNPRPARLPGDSHGSTLLRLTTHMVSIRARPIAGRFWRTSWLRSDQCIGFNPRPARLPGDSPMRAAARSSMRPDVSIRARPDCRAIPYLRDRSDNVPCVSIRARPDCRAILDAASRISAMRTVFQSAPGPIAGRCSLACSR